MRSTPATRGLLAAMAVCMALQMTGFNIFLPLFALRFETFGAGVEALSASDMAYALIFALAAPFAGVLADRVGRRPIVLASLGGQALVFVGYLFAASTWVLILLRGLAGFFTAGILPCLVSVIGDVAPEDRRGRWVGILTGGAAVGYIVGPTLGGLLYERLGYVTPSAIAIGMALAALLLAAVRIRESLVPAAHPAHPISTWIRELRILPARSTFFLVLFVTFGVMFAFAFVQPQFMFYAYDDLRWTSYRLGLVISAFSVAYTVCQFALGQLSDRVGRKPVLVLGLALFSVQFLGLVIFHDAVWIVVSFAIAGVGNALYEPALSAMVLDMAPPEHTAGMLGLRTTAGSIGSMLGPGVVVLFASFLTPQVGFLMATALVALLALASARMLNMPKRAGVALPN